MPAHATTSRKPWPIGVQSDGRHSPRRILIVDDHPIVREGLVRVLNHEQDLMICAQGESAREARAAIKQCDPDLLITDVSLTVGDGMELVREVRAHHPRLPILVLSMHDEQTYAQRLLSAGANGYLMKTTACLQLLAAVRLVLAGHIYVSECIRSRMIKRWSLGDAAVAIDGIDSLTNRELQVLSMIGRAASTRETARSLNLSVKTIESHQQRIKRKLRLVTGRHLTQYAMNWCAGRKPLSPIASDRQTETAE
jgi:DNA-binding NarL/FixJ family response regulator